MSQKSKIEWTEATWNPVSGCTKVSAGCAGTHRASLRTEASGYRQTAQSFASRVGAEWEPEPDVGRVAHGVPARVDRLRGLGNAIVPRMAEFWVSVMKERMEVERWS